MRRAGRRQADKSSIQANGHLRRAGAQGRLVVRLFGLTAALLGVGIGIALGLLRVAPPARSPSGPFIVPTAFAFSTLLLFFCSAAQGRALSAVRRERQTAFRRSLAAAVAFATAFVGVQAFGLFCIVQSLGGDRGAGEAQLGATSLVLGAATLHALHVVVALFFLSYVNLQSHADRYDHEYSFGVAVCAWFWHILGVLWFFILGAYGIVYSFLSIRVPQP